jgi:hypothetical protein
VSSDKDGRTGPEGSPAGWDAGGEHLVVPDDISELDADIRAYHREVRASSRRRVLRRVFVHSRFGITLPVLLAALFLAALYSVVMLVVASPRPQAPHGVALANPKTAPGRVGGLLPKVRIADSKGSFTEIRALRPAVVMLVPAKCNCAGEIRSAASAAEHARLHVTVVGTSMPTRPSNISDSLISLRREPTDVLLPAYDVAAKPVILLVRSDGVVSRVLHTLPTSARLDNDVRQLANSAPSR